jgi:hypothetical protein
MILDIELLYAHIHFGIPTKQEIVDWIEVEIIAGVNTDFLDELLITSDADFKSQIGTVLKALKVEKPSQKSLTIMAAKFTAEKIISGKLSPYDGAKKIWFEIENDLEDQVEESNELSIFAGLASEYEDFFEDAQLEFYGKDKCQVIQCETQRKIIEEAKALLST